MTDTPDPKGGDNSFRAAKADLQSYIDRVARLEEERASLAADIKEVFAEAKSKGYDTKALRLAISLSKKDKELLTITKLYSETLEMDLFA